MSSSRDTHASSDEPQKEPPKCVARFKNGKQCVYNAKPGRMTCDRPGHSSWGSPGASNSSTHANTAYESDTVSDTGIDDEIAEQLICTAKTLSGRPCTNKRRSGQTTCGISRHKNYDNITPNDEVDPQQGREPVKIEYDTECLERIEGGRPSLGSNASGLEGPTALEDKGSKEQEWSRAKDYACHQGDLAMSSEQLALKQRGSDSTGDLGDAGGSRIYEYSDKFESTEDFHSAVDKEVKESRCIAKREYLNERCDQKREIGFHTCKIKFHRDQEPLSTHMTQYPVPPAASTTWRLGDPLHFAESSKNPYLPLETTPELSVDPKTPSAASTNANTQITQDERPSDENAAHTDLGMARLLKDNAMFKTLEALQEEEDEINRRHHDKAKQSSQIYDLVHELRLMSTKNNETHLEILRSSQAVVRGLTTVSGGQVNEERFFQEMRALKATLMDSLKKQDTSRGGLGEDILAKIGDVVRESRCDRGDGGCRRGEITREIDIIKTFIEESIVKHRSVNALFNGDTANEIKEALQAMRIETGQRDDQRDDDLERVFQEVRTLKATVGETFSKLHKWKRSLSEDRSAENEAVQTIHFEKVQKDKLAKEKCKKLKAQRDEQYDVVDNLLRAFIARYKHPL